ncbi:hypothetical protein LOZ12_001513 [Ophidiomyces ophidiicola]|uniref:Uncharacterized protein n=1 Tax=Ophidiomyces ophidiicola TaxID=1387563 RepID=A0ACB8V7X9_9EURO|nr:uncharacterized protein LOZ57_005645 [Ophidiomyces ophidiicola]KAI1941516.1 hypothetical protein LOZ57_005645 [Ophidiomyces ophidiicola]KAI1961709.1 hypothetical protein LOZ59_002360 [Ophidiomyces ophidiicola]KAI2000540.1 hypothetical protein LOZ50_005848 [Ophidiomyces ophidiicola]KAI2033101.1 hypothetical protein LOZ47_005541 [Ophidiomyces ophidiicola]KAI2043656.1 hypothetical protein LOZ44_005351 [Ophidiomyces ophidiicola]
MAEGYIPVDDDEDDGDAIRRDECASTAARSSLLDRTAFDPESSGTIVNQDTSSFDSLQDHHPKQSVPWYLILRNEFQELQGWASMWLAYQSIGAIYGDIGTSPLYVFSAVFTTPPESIDLLGALSLIIWALILIATVKYVGIVLCANNDGEGGSFALLSLIRRHIPLDWRDSISDHSDLQTYKEKELKGPNSFVRNAIQQSHVAKRAVTILAVLGVCMVISDGVITPAQSILGAVQGIKIAAPDMSTNVVVVVTCILIVVLFTIQPFGTSRLSNFFAPIVMVWLIFNMSFGIYNLVFFDHSVLQAFSPRLAVDYMIRHRFNGWRSLGGILLSFTGVEALFADLGAFSVKQAAFISGHPDAIVNPLFKAVPPGMYWPTLILSILASIVASQAMLTGTFQLISQAIRMAYLPRIRRVHTSKRVTSQIYIPLANWLMMLGSLAVTSVFKTTTRIGNVYGVCVVGVSFITTWLVTLVAVIIWNLHILIVLPVFLFIGFFDVLFVGAALAKVPAGGWFTVIMASILTSTLLMWSYGEGCQFHAERDESASQSTIFTSHDQLWLRDGKAEYSVKTIRGIGVFLIEPNSRSPPVFDHFIKKFEATHEISILLQIRPLMKYSVAVKDRFTLTATNVTGLYRATLRYGYGDTPSWDSFEEMLTDELGIRCPTEEVDSSRHTHPNTSIDSDSIPLTGSTGHAVTKPITYVIGRDKLYVRKNSGLIRRVILAIFTYLKGHEKTKLSRLNVPVDRLVEVSFSKAI